MSEEYDIRSLVPHDGTLLLLDKVVSVGDRGLTASVVLHEKSPFAESQGVPSWVGLEYMGQAIAAYAGVCARRQRELLRIGFLVSTRRYEPGCNFFPLGEELQITVEALTDTTTGLQVFSCTIRGPDIDIEANLNVFVPENLEEFMHGSQK